MGVVVRTVTEPLSFASSLKKALAEVLPDRPPASMTTMESVVRDSTGSRRLPMLLLSTFAVLALVLAAVGIVGVVSHAVTQRTHEIGIRLALGARTADVLRLMVNSSMAWVMVGLVAGVVGSAGVTSVLTGMLYGVQPLDPLVLGGASLLLAGVALLASYWPARRAVKIDPIIALRFE